MQVWENLATGSTQLTPISLHNTVMGYYQIWIKVVLNANGSKTDAGVSNLKITTIFEHNRGGMPYLDKGTNNITVTFDNPQDLAAGAAFKVTYKWKEYDGSGWTIDKVHEQYVATSPFTYTIETGGTKVPRTESIEMAVVEPPMPDGIAPAPVTDLAGVDPNSNSVDLTWTASGDDWDAGQASGYDIRYSSTAITADTFDAATSVINPPSPKLPGNAERCQVRGLQASTLYYFALKVRDEGGNWSGMSNVASATTLPPDITPPAWVGNLLGKRSKSSGGIDLTWTATGDDGHNGTATSYDLRYSTSPIDEGNFAAATPVAGVSAPKAAGAAESLTVTGLTGGTEYYFALKVTDDVGNTSEISNTARATASVLGEKVLQDGVGGYTGCSDNYVEAVNPTIAYGDRERMRICGFADSDPTNRDRAMVKFDLSGIPAGTVITKATFSLYAYDQNSWRGSTGFYGVYPLTATWAEFTSCWNLASTGTSWAQPGGDFSTTADALSPKQAVAKVWYNFDVTARVQGWIGGTVGNNGWCIKVDDENRHSQDTFYSSDSSDPGLRPMLVISDLPPVIIGDVAGDGHVDVNDLLAMAQCWALHLGDRGYDPKCDFNGDGSIDVIDLLLLADNWGK